MLSPYLPHPTPAQIAASEKVAAEQNVWPNCALRRREFVLTHAQIAASLENHVSYYERNGA